MNSRFHFPLVAAGFLAFLTSCATTVTEKEKPTNASQIMVRPDSTGAAATAIDARIATPDANGTTAPADAAAPNILSAADASAEREKEKKMTALDYHNMVANADAILKVDPKSAKAYLQRAKAKSYLKDYAQALPDYAAAIRYQRDNPDAYYNRGVNHLMMKQYKAATSDFSGALKYRPEDKESLFGRGVAKMQMYQYKSAVVDFTKAIQADSAYADAWEYRGISYSSFDKLSEARRDLEKAATLNPEAGKSLRRYVGNADGRAPIKTPVTSTTGGYHPRPGMHKPVNQ